MPTFSPVVILILTAAATIFVVVGARVANILYVFLSERGFLSVGDSTPRATGSAADGRHFVYYSSPSRFWKHIKLVPWDAYGEFTIGDFELTFSGHTKRGEKIELTFPKFDSLMTYVPANFLRDGGLTWVAIGNHKEMHYFTCGRAMLEISTVSTSTTGLYEAVTDTFVREKSSVAVGE